MLIEDYDPKDEGIDMNLAAITYVTPITVHSQR